MAKASEDLKAARDALCTRILELARDSKSLSQCADALKIVHDVYTSERLTEDELDGADTAADRGAPQAPANDNRADSVH